MKKLSVFLILAIAAFAFVGCSDEGTGLRWKNSSNTSQGIEPTKYVEIQWVNPIGIQDSGASWNDIPGKGSFTQSKEVKSLTGNGEIVDNGGDIFQILLDNDGDVAGVAAPVKSGDVTAYLKKDADVTLVIGDEGSKVLKK